MSMRTHPRAGADLDEHGRWPKWLAYPFIFVVGLTVWGLFAGAWVFISLHYSP